MKAPDPVIRRFERTSGRVLEVGVMLSAACLALGLVLWALGMEPAASEVLQAGLLLLMVTPAARVLVSLAEYLYVRDWFFVATTAAVILVLLAGTLSALMATGN